jgi:RNA polymerase subunit RPABC4/transcription elongation factor Spt4
VSPAVIGNASLACSEEVEKQQLEEMEEGAAGVSWQKCTGCAFMCGAHEPVCMVCGTHNQAHNWRDGVIEASKLKRAIAQPMLDDAASMGTVETSMVYDCHSHEQSQTEGIIRASELKDAAIRPLLDEKASVSTVSPAHSSDEGSGDDEEADSDSEEAHEEEQKEPEEQEYEEEQEEDIIEDTLDIPPPQGTLVTILNEDDEWQPATVLRVSGTRARVRLEDGEQVVLDFSVHAVRLAVHDEASDSEEEEIPGTLAYVPPAGTLVEILHENDKWEPVRIISSNGTVARVVDSDGDEEDVDFDSYHVRLHDYAL